MVDVEGFEGPLDLLLALARQQKVDLAKISILALAEQYLAFIEEARKLRLELAADYLVMAAWLAYLKSRLLLPEPATPDGPSAEDMANALACGCKRLEAFREVVGPAHGPPAAAARRVPARRSGADRRHQASAMDRDALRPALGLCAAAPAERARPCALQAAHRLVAAGGARGLERLIGQAGDWGRLDQFLIEYLVEPSMRATVMASSFAATLELVREGALEVHQQSAFAPIYLRKRDEAALAAVNSSTAMPRATE